jgi:hypothetical protein
MAPVPFAVAQLTRPNATTQMTRSCYGVPGVQGFCCVDGVGFARSSP